MRGGGAVYCLSQAEYYTRLYRNTCDFAYGYCANPALLTLYSSGNVCVVMLFNTDNLKPGIQLAPRVLEKGL